MIERFQQWLCGLFGHKPVHIAEGRFECMYCRKEFDPYA